MSKPQILRLLAVLVPVCTCALVAGCLSGRPKEPTDPLPPGLGYESDFGPRPGRIELRPKESSAPVRGTQVFIATLYDAQGVPMRNRRIDWVIEGPGAIIEVDEGDSADDRGRIADNRHAFSFTDDREQTIARGQDEFTVRPGQTWCVVTSAVEGETTVVASAAATADRDKVRASSRIRWTVGEFSVPATDGRVSFPRPATTRAGGEYTLTMNVPGNAVADYRIRYRIVDGPPAALASSRDEPLDSVTEAVARVGPDGTARVQISQPAPAAGTNRIAIDVIKLHRDNPDEYTVVSKGETKVTWRAAELRLNISAPKSIARSQELPVTYRVAGSERIDADVVTLTAKVPAGMEVVRTEPRAAVDGDELIWNLPVDKPLAAKAVYRPMRVGESDFTADVRIRGGPASRSSASVAVTEAKLQVKLEGPTTGLVNEALTFEATVSNAGNAPSERIRVRARLDDGLEAEKNLPLDQTIAPLSPGQSKTISIPVVARKGGKLTVHADATTETGLIAAPQFAHVQVHNAQVSVSVHGPARGYVGQEVTWQLIARNTGDVPLDRVELRASLPSGIKFVQATEEGRQRGRQVVWDIQALKPNEERPITLTGHCEKLSGPSVMNATIVVRPAAGRDRSRRSDSTAKPIAADRPVESPFEIIGIPALQVSIADSVDPVGVGQRTTYTIRVKNAGTVAATKVIVAATVPGQAAKAGEPPQPTMRVIRASGPGSQGRIDKEQVTFPPIDSLAPNREATFVVEVETLMAGDTRLRAEVRSVLDAQPLQAEEPTRVLGAPTRPTER